MLDVYNRAGALGLTWYHLLSYVVSHTDFGHSWLLVCILMAIISGHPMHLWTLLDLWTPIALTSARCSRGHPLLVCAPIAREHTLHLWTPIALMYTSLVDTHYTYLHGLTLWTLNALMYTRCTYGRVYSLAGGRGKSIRC